MKRLQIMGIVNVTPDSFSGDGVLAEHAIAHAKALVEAGADILDIGAESTRPGATALSAEEEWARLAPVLHAVAKADWRSNISLSVDTRHAQTAAQSLALGVDIINDVGGLRDDNMGALLANHTCNVVVMHALTLPADKAITLPDDCDPVAEVLRWKAEISECAEAIGIRPSRLIFDPGIGFGKTPAQSLALVLRAREYVNNGRWLIGHSRKSFFSLFTEEPARERDALTRAFSAHLAEAGAGYLRVHDVAGHRQMFDVLCI